MSDQTITILIVVGTIIALALILYVSDRMHAKLLREHNEKIDQIYDDHYKKLDAMYRDHYGDFDAR